MLFLFPLFAIVYLIYIILCVVLSALYEIADAIINYNDPKNQLLPIYKFIIYVSIFYGIRTTDNILLFDIECNDYINSKIKTNYTINYDFYLEQFNSNSLNQIKYENLNWLF